MGDLTEAQVEVLAKYSDGTRHKERWTGYGALFIMGLVANGKITPSGIAALARQEEIK